MRKRQRKRQRMSGGKKKKGGRALITFIDSLPDTGGEPARGVPKSRIVVPTNYLVEFVLLYF